MTKESFERGRKATAVLGVKAKGVLKTLAEGGEVTDDLRKFCRDSLEQYERDAGPQNMIRLCSEESPHDP